MRDRNHIGDAKLRTDLRPRPALVPLSNHFAFRWRCTRDDVFAAIQKKYGKSLRACESSMLAMLRHRGVSDADAHQITCLTLHDAADHQLSKARWQQIKRNREDAVQARKDVIRQLDRLIGYLWALPQQARLQMNEILRAHDTRVFDSEMFACLIEEMGEALHRDPSKAFRQAYQVIYKPVGTVAPEITRTARSELIDRWECMPPDIRRRIEAQIRLASRSHEVTKFLAILVDALRKDRPVTWFNALPTSQFTEKLALRWRRAGLQVGCQYNSYLEKAVDSRFQRFARAALLAFRDPSRISRYQIREIQ